MVDRRLEGGGHHPEIYSSPSSCDETSFHHSELSKKQNLEKLGHLRFHRRTQSGEKLLRGASWRDNFENRSSVGSQRSGEAGRQNLSDSPDLHGNSGRNRRFVCFPPNSDRSGPNSNCDRFRAGGCHAMQVAGQ